MKSTVPLFFLNLLSTTLLLYFLWTPIVEVAFPKAVLEGYTAKQIPFSTAFQISLVFSFFAKWLTPLSFNKREK